MEQEYKWKLNSPAHGEALLAHPAVQPWLIGRRAIHMAATYYDTPEGLLWGLHGGLRLRREDDLSVCCLKLEVRQSGGCTLREEYEAEASTITEGLALLPGRGAPAGLCDQLLNSGLVELCAVSYTRQACQLRVTEDGVWCEGELTVDLGTARRQGRTGPVCESEFEYQAGAPDLFHAFAHRLEAALALVPEPDSKLARAMGL